MAQKEIDFQWCDQQRILRECDLPPVKSKDGVTVRPLTMKAMLIAIASHRPRCWASVATLGREAGGMSTRHAKRSVAALKLLGVLATEKRPGRSDEHSVVWSELSLLCGSGASRGTGALGAHTGALRAHTGALEGTRGLKKIHGSSIDHRFLVLKEESFARISEALALENRKPCDRTINFARVVSGMRASGLLSEHDLASALNLLRIKGAEIENPGAYLRKVLRESLTRDGADFDAELAKYLESEYAHA